MKKQFFLTLVLAFALLSLAAPAFAQAPTAEGGVVIASPFPAVIADKGKLTSFSLEIVNEGKTWQDLELKAEGPADWAPVFKQAGSTVRRVMVAPGKSQALEFQCKPPATATAGDYTFTVQGLGKDGKPAAELKLSLTLQDKIAPTGLKMTTQYPENRGQAGTTFSWRVTLNNEAEQDRPVSFSASLPSGWDVAFKAGYESRQITTLSVQGGSSQDVTVDIITPQRAEAGDYNIVLRATADKDIAELPLKLTLIGNYKVSLTTASGQLNAKATVDKETKVTLVVRNTGTAPLKEVTMSASRPDGWEVTFEPEKLTEVPVGESIQVNATLKPSTKVLAGDYMVSMSAYASQTSDSKDIRVTVETPTTWGIAAIAAIVIIVGGLVLIFARFSRR